MKSLVAVFLLVLLSLAGYEANRLTKARVPSAHARGPTTANGTFICFNDDENGFQICIQEGTAPQIKEGEPGYGTQNYVGYFSLLGDPLTSRGFVYGHSLAGRVNMYLFFEYQTNFYSYSFDYCPEVWKNPPTAYFSVYHVIVGSLTTGTIVGVIAKNPFVQQNPNIGFPGGAQIACSTERYPTQVEPPVPPPQVPPPTSDAKPPTPGKMRTESTLVARGPSVAGTPSQGFCFYEDYHPEEKWWFAGGTGSLLDNEASPHQYYYGEVRNINTGVVSYAFGHSPRASRSLIFSSNIPFRGLLTYHVMLNPDNHNEVQSGYIYIGSPDNMELKQVFQRVQFFRC